jgi:hypothetical protein
MVDKKGTSTIPVPAIAAETPPITIGPSVVPFDATGGLIIRAGQTLRAGDSPIAISGTTYSIGASAIVIIDHSGTSTIPLPVSKEYITVGSHTYTMVNGKLIMGDRLTLSGAGGMVIFAGTTIMLKSGSVVVVSKEGTSVVPVKSKAGGSKADEANVTEVEKDGDVVPTAKAEASAASLSVGFVWSLVLLFLALVI